MPTHLESLSKYRFIGELESLGKDRLPLPDITPGAKRLLLGWGLDEVLIGEILEFCSSFRYDLCLEKLQRLTRSPAYVVKEDDSFVIKLPFFYDPMGRGDGQCGDIARNVIIQAKFSGLIDSLNVAVTKKTKQKIVPYFASGRSATHFCSEGSNHVWNGLALVKNEKIIGDRVIIDASFQKIMLESESNYEEKKLSRNPTEIETAVEGSCKVGYLEFEEYTWGGYVFEQFVLGISANKKYIYALTFLEVKKPVLSNRQPYPIIPEILRFNADGSIAFFFYHPLTQKLTSWNVEYPLIAKEEREIRELLDAAELFNFQERSALNESTTGNEYLIKW